MAAILYTSSTRCKVNVHLSEKHPTITTLSRLVLTNAN